MLWFGHNSDNFTYPFVLKACGDLIDVEIGRGVRFEVVCGDMVLACAVFDRVPVRDLTSWNTVISGYVKNGEAEEDLRVFYIMREDGVFPDGNTLLGVLSACAQLVAVQLAKEVLGYVVRKSYELSNEFLNNSLIEMYCNCNSMDNARRLFEKMAWKDTVSWNSMFAGYVEKEDASESLTIFCHSLAIWATRGGIRPFIMNTEVTLIADLWAALLSACQLHQNVQQAEISAQKLFRTNLKHVVSYVGRYTWMLLRKDEMMQKGIPGGSTVLETDFVTAAIIGE
ncbi:unnamed protein product [Dovyalis caffra]|uniref:Pentatricopeptide repeat-containing protein n=1 Tax=Dovyalis caffra TaxID=77055 RepID=A0AAV1SS09_9ROSI|nr:unnamed protein product [Dovyalis caffra]